MVQRVSTVAFEGIEARAVDVQVQVVPGLPNFLPMGYISQMISALVRPFHLVQYFSPRSKNKLSFRAFSAIFGPIQGCHD